MLKLNADSNHVTLHNSDDSIVFNIYEDGRLEVKEGSIRESANLIFNLFFKNSAISSKNFDKENTIRIHEVLLLDCNNFTIDYIYDKEAPQWWTSFQLEIKRMADLKAFW
jgi:hypothetical protein